MLHLPSNSIGSVVPLFGGGAGGAGGGGFLGPRDAHRIVVGFSAAPYNDAATAADYLDPGDGSGLAAALAAALALGFPCDIRLRPGTITMPNALTPFTVPAGCRLIGAEVGETIINGPVGTLARSQQMFALGANAGIEHLTLYSPPPAVASPVANGVIIGASGSFVRHVNLTLDVNLVGQARTTPHGYYSAQPDGNDIEWFYVSTLARDVQLEIAIVFDAAVNYYNETLLPARVSNCSMTNGATLLNSTNWYDVDADTLSHQGCSAISVFFASTNAFAPANNATPGPRVRNIRATTTASANVFVHSLSTTGVLVFGGFIDGITAAVDGVPTVPVNNVVLIEAFAGTIYGFDIRSITAVQANILIGLLVQGATGLISAASITGARAALASITLSTFASGGTVSQTSIANVTTALFFLNDANVVDTVIHGGHGAVTDNGTGTEVGHVIP